MADNKPKGWFSRRHQTNEGHVAARQAYEERAIGRPKQFAQWDEDSENGNLSPKFSGWDRA